MGNPFVGGVLRNGLGNLCLRVSLNNDILCYLVPMSATSGLLYTVYKFYLTAQEEHKINKSVYQKTMFYFSYFRVAPLKSNNLFGKGSTNMFSTHKITKVLDRKERE